MTAAPQRWRSHWKVLLATVAFAALVGLLGQPFLAVGSLLAIAAFYIALPGHWAVRAVGALLLAALVMSPAGQLEAERNRASERARAATKTATGEAETQELARSLKAALDAADWDKATVLLKQLESFSALHPDVLAAREKLRAHRVAMEATQSEAERRAQVTEGLAEARRVVSDPTLCGEPQPVADAWAKLRLAKVSDPEWATAAGTVSRLEACRLKVERAITAAVRALRVQRREEWAGKAETPFLDQGMDVRIRLSGPNKDRVSFTWSLMGRAAVHKLTDGDSMEEGTLLARLQGLGFSRVIFSDGAGESYTYTLTPEDESLGGWTTLREMGLGDPLRLE